jgi:hypothetical protein|tara:strand:+ start:549 stop:965 length:417 start_codon:yes stop_codon:yes gene_type:complete
MGLQKISLRMYLPHLLENKKTLEFLTSTYEELGNPTILYLWYDKKKDSVEPKELKEFITNWERRDHYRTHIHTKLVTGPQNFIWFDIVPAGINTSEVSGRFQYHYYNPDNLVEGIKKFKEIVDFCTQNKTVKKQKRTD